MSLSTATFADPTREELPSSAGATVVVSARWVQQALRTSGAAVVVDGQAGPSTMEALRAFKARRAAADPVVPSTVGADRFPTSVIVGTITEMALRQAMATGAPARRATPNEAAAEAAEPRTIIGPNLDPPLATRSSSRNWTPWLIGGAAVVALGAAYLLLNKKPARRARRRSRRR